MTLASGDRIGDWVIEAPLGEGGMGAVYRVHSTLSERLQAALKVMKPTTDPEGRARFVREAEALSAVSHPGIVRVMGFSEDPARGVPYIVMELAHGETLRQRVMRGPLSTEEALRTFLPLAAALDHAHRSGIFHRDVKPSNVILTRDGVKLVDFGIATGEDFSTLTTSGHLGTLAYVPPEAFRGERPNPSAIDVYGFGVCLYESLTGTPAFPVDRHAAPAVASGAVAARKLSQRPLDPGPQFADVLREVVSLATDPDPAVRPGISRILDLLSSLQRSKGRRSADRHPSDATTTLSAVDESGPRTTRVPEPAKPAYNDPLPAWWGRTQRRVVAQHPRALVLWAAAAFGVIALVALGARGVGTGADEASASADVTAGPRARPTPEPGLQPGTARTNPRDGLEYVWVPEGRFEMGCTPGDPLCDPKQLPSKPITLARGFWLSRTEATVDAWRRYAEGTGGGMPPAPSFNRGWEKGRHPVVNVAWRDAREFCAWAGGRLPTEAEWEWAARGGRSDAFHPWGNENPVCTPGAPNGARFDDDGACSIRGTERVGAYGRNGFGIHDMSGNVWEWTEDAWTEDFDATPSDGGPATREQAARRVIRGGSWVNEARYMRVSIRSRWYEGGGSRDFIGVRCVLDQLRP
jgi:formylglycine-generating enzyme required for sulfatase activity